MRRKEASENFLSVPYKKTDEAEEEDFVQIYFLNYDLIVFDVYLIAYGPSYISTIATSHLKSTEEFFVTNFGFKFYLVFMRPLW